MSKPLEIQLDYNIEIPTYEGLIIEKPTITLIETRDIAHCEMFYCVIFIKNKVFAKDFILPEQPYVNGTWDDETVQNAIENYIKENYADKE
jgi:hypothetical protein